MAGSPELSHACTYQGWEAVDGQCDFPWARDTNRTFRSNHHRIEKGEVNVVKPVESKKAPLRDQMTAAMEPKLNNP
jgi:hypothetical protein